MQQELPVKLHLEFGFFGFYIFLGRKLQFSLTPSWVRLLVQEKPASQVQKIGVLF